MNKTTLSGPNTGAIRSLMKNSIILIMLIAFTTVSFAQQTTPKENWKDSDLYKKSANQKRMAWILLGSGTGLFIGGMIAHFSYVNSHDDVLAGVTSVTTGEVVAFIGLATAGGSIPCFIAASRNKKKAQAASVFIDMEKAQVLQGTAFSYQPFPAVGLRIPL